jgi:hypothetical protein
MLRPVALIAAAVGGAGSVAFLLQAGRRNSSLILLVVLFSIWVLSPFLALLWGILRADRFAETVRSTLYGLTVVVALASLAIYSRVIDLKPAGSPNTFLFVAVPPLSWVIIVAVMAAAFLAARRRT